MSLFLCVHIPMLLLLFISAVTDYKYKIIPIYSYVILAIYYLIIALLNNIFNPINSIVAAIISFIVFGLMAWKANGGIGDIFMMVGLSFCLGIQHSLYLIVFSSIFFILSFVVEWIVEINKHKNKHQHFNFTKFYKKERPFAPSVLCGYVVLLLYLLINSFCEGLIVV